MELASLDNLKQQGLYRSRNIIESPQGLYLSIDGKKVLNFCSNDYLGLANHPMVKEAFKKAIDDYGVGSGSAHLICGHSKAHHALEEELAEFTKRDKALLFSTGYMANLGIICALLTKNDVILEDKLNHASLIDGGLFSTAQFKRYAHADTIHLTQLINQVNGNILIATDGVFSMDGDIAPLNELSTIAKTKNAWIMVDDAHGLGTMGLNGGGTLELFNLTQNDVPILMGTLGKAFGTFGAFVAGSHELIETLIQKARTYIYTTALPPAVAQATRTSLFLVKHEIQRREYLNSLIEYFKYCANQLNLPLMPSQSAIQPLFIGDSFKAQQLSQRLFEKGFWVSAIRPPTVPKGTARLRITLSALHQKNHIEELLDVVKKEFTDIK